MLAQWKKRSWCFWFCLLQPHPEEPGHPVLHHEGYRQTRHPKSHGGHSWSPSGKVFLTDPLLTVNMLNMCNFYQKSIFVLFEKKQMIAVVSPWTESNDRSTWASTSTHSTRLWLQPQERQWTEVWPTGRESTSQKKFITQVRRGHSPARTIFLRFLCVLSKQRLSSHNSSKISLHCLIYNTVLAIHVGRKITKYCVAKFTLHSN